MMGLRYDIESLSSEYRGLQGEVMPDATRFGTVEQLCTGDNACFKTLEVNSFDDSTINNFSTMLQEEILIFKNYLEISIIERANKLQNLFDVIKLHTERTLPGFILAQTGSLFTSLLMPWSDLNVLISLGKGAKHLNTEDVLQQFLACMQACPGVVRDYKTIKNQSYGIIKVNFYKDKLFLF
jgi:hypothetical protein